jgi:tetratricopeptide (TPR) repeat protein
MRLKDHTSAKAVYTAAFQSEGLLWAKLGMARAEFESGQGPKAMRLLEGLIEDFPEYADAYDVMSQVQLEQGDLAAALETSRDSVRVTPHSVTRLQKQGMLAFLLGENKEAAQTLDRTVRIGLKSKMFDFQTLVVMALLNFDEGNQVDLKRALTHLEVASERRPGDAALKRMARVAGALNRLSSGSLTACTSLARKISADIAHMDFDYEAASNLLALLARLRKANVEVPEADTWVNDLSRRFCVSKASCEMLCIAAGNDPIYSALIHEGHHSISNMAEEAMAHSVSGEPSVAVEALLLRGAETCNAKLIELASAVLSRHSAQISVFDALEKKVNDLKIRYCAKGAQVRLGQNPLRAAGGLNLRS